MNTARVLQPPDRASEGSGPSGLLNALLSIRGRLTLLVAAVFLPLSAFVTVLAVNDADAQRTALEAKSRDAVAALLGKADGILTGLVATLSSLCASPSLGRAGGEFERHAAGIVASADLDFIRADDPEGRQLFVAAQTPDVQQPPPEVMAPLRAKALSGVPAVSDVVPGRDGSKAYFIVTVPVMKDGVVAAVLSAASSLEKFGPVIRGLGLESGWAAAVIDRRGIIIAHSADEGLAGKPAAGDVHSIELGGKSSGSSVGTSRNGVRVFRTYSRLANGWVASVSVPVDTLEAPLRRTLRILGVVGASFGFFALGLATLIAKRIADGVRSLSAAAVALVDGAPVPPVSNDITELKEVASAFKYARKVIEERNEAALRVEESERRLRRVLDSLFAFVGVLDRDGILLETNAAALRAAAISRKDVIGKPYWECYWWSYSTASQERLKAAIERARAGETVRYDAEFRVKEGAFVPVDFQLAPVMVDGCVAQLVPSALDITERKRAEEALRASEARFRGIFDNAAIGAALIGLDGRWQTVNDRLCGILGYDRDELLAKTVQELTHPEDLQKEQVLSKELIAGSIPNYTFEKRYLNKSGAAVWTEIAVSLKRGIDGAPKYFISVLSDISERKAAEEAVRAAEERERRRRVELETVLEAIPAAVIIAGDGPDAPVTANRASRELLRLPEDAEFHWAATEGLEVVAHGRVVSVEEFPVQMAAATGKPVLGAEIDLRFADGEVKHIYGNALPFLDCLGRAHGAVGAFVDITERRRAEVGLRRTEARLRRLQDSNIIGIMTVDDTKILDANRVLLEMIGRDEGDLRSGGIDWRSITPPEYTAADAKALEQLRKFGFCEPFEKEYFRPDGTRVPILIGAAEVESEPRQYVCFVLDLTERRLAENRIRFLMREVSHRSKNLLAVVQAMTFQTARSATSIEEFQTRLEERLQGLAISHDLLVKRDWRGIPLLELVRRQVLPLAGKGENRLTIEGPPLVLTPEASQSLGFALHELATNAMKYGAFSKPSGHVTLTWSVTESKPSRFRMNWVERGGPPVHPPKRKGFGTAVVERMLSAALEGEVKLQFLEQGVCWSIDAPADCLQNDAFSLSSLSA